MPEFQETIEIEAPADAVWELAGDPGQIADWLPALTTSELSGSVTDMLRSTYREGLESLRDQVERGAGA